MAQETVTASDLRSVPARAALLGWSAETFEGLRKAGRPFLAVVPPEFAGYMEQHEIPYEPWDFDKLNEKSAELTERLRARGVEYTVPLYEETVEWSGAITAGLESDPHIFRRALLFRDKASMKRMAQMAGLQVGVFEEVNTREDVARFLRRVNDALAKLDEEDPDPVHLKPFAAAGTVGHRIIRSKEDIMEIPDDAFPLLAESNLAGQEFSCEVFVHDGKIAFLNITEYVHLGHSDFVPASPNLEKHRPAIMEACQRLIEAFRFRNGIMHPEFFVDTRGDLKFGEVAARIPGGSIFESIRDAHGFDPYVGYVLCADPQTSEEELQAFFPKTPVGSRTYAGVLMVYPRQQTVSELKIPQEVLDDPYFDRHTLAEPLAGKVAAREGFGNHWGTLFFKGDDPERMRDILERFEGMDFYA